jgi:hypothetical protein
MKRRYREIYEDDLLRDGQRLRVPMFAMDSAQRGGSPHLPRVHDGTGDSGFHRPGFRVSDAPPSDELQIAREDYLHDLTTAWQRGAGKKDVVPVSAGHRDGYGGLHSRLTDPFDRVSG